MSLTDLFRFRTVASEDIIELPEAFPFSIDIDTYIKLDIISVYKKILIDCVERIHGLNEDINNALWDSCLSNEASKGLISHLSEAMMHQSDLFLVYKIGVLRKATNEESVKIKAEFEKSGESREGVFISFKTFDKSRLLKVFSSLEYISIASLDKTMNVSNAIQYKMKGLREGVSLNDSSVAIRQAAAIAKAISEGKDALMDKEDVLETMKPDLSSTEKAIEFVNKNKSFILGMPISYITGEQTAGIGSTGEADMRAVERGLLLYFNSILKPVLKSLFRIKPSFKSEDFRMLDSALNAIKTLELVSDELFPYEEKWNLVRKLFKLNEKKAPKKIEEPEPEPELEIPEIGVQDKTEDVKKNN